MSGRIQIAPKTPAPSTLPLLRGGVLQRQCACGKSATVEGEWPACRKKRQGLQRQAATPGAEAVAPPLVHQVLNSPGQPLTPTTRHWMEARLGHDFSQVRVHADSTAAASAQAVQARAYTVGQQVVFGAGAYAPATPAGQQLLAHELTHVIQQHGHRSGGASSPAGDLVIGAVDDPLEREAAAVAYTVTQSGAARLQRHASALHLQRLPDMPAAQGLPDRFQQSGASTLPYREATELVECVRIMGEDNAAYCRQEVLGEQPQPTPPPPPPPPCTPTALPRAQYLAQPGTSTDDFGLTRLAGTVSVPVVQTRRVRGGFRLEETAAALPPITSVYTDAGIFTEGTAVFLDSGGAECPSGRYPMRWIIAADGRARFVMANWNIALIFSMPLPSPYNVMPIQSTSWPNVGVSFPVSGRQKRMSRVRSGRRPLIGAPFLNAWRARPPCVMAHVACAAGIRHGPSLVLHA
ncbi:MAG: DUF4157 domain-containing protein [Caldilineaceae bacterium]